MAIKHAKRGVNGNRLLAMPAIQREDEGTTGRNPSFFLEKRKKQRKTT